MSKTYKYFCQDRVDSKKLLCKDGVVCGGRYVSQGDLTRHRKTHTGIKEHCCDSCDKKFHQKTQLTNHHHVHTGETPHMCDICQEQFKDPSSCSRHRKEQHEGNYVCFVDGCRKAIARKSNFRKHLQGHRAYRPDIVFENHWVRRDQPRPKRTGRKSGPSKSRVATKVDNPPPISFKPEAQEERFGPIEVPQLYVTHATSMPNQTLHPDNAHPIYIPPTAVQSHEFQICPHQSEKVLELELQEFIDSRNLQSFPSFTPPSLSSSHQAEIYQQSLSYPMPVQLGFDARSPLPWMELQMPDDEALQAWIDGLSNSGPSPYIWPAEGCSLFDTDFQMVS